MRQSEKILLSFLLLGVVSMGSFIGWKYYQNSQKANTTTKVLSSNDAQLQESLNVSANPFYDVSSGKKIGGRLILPEEEQNQNRNSGNPVVAKTNNNSSVKPVVTANTNTNANLVPASVENKNTNLNPVPAPQSTESFSFAIVGDSQGFEKGNPKGSLQKAVNNISNAKVDLVMTVGDLISSCDGNDCASKFADWKSIMSPLLDKTKEIQGNHDRSEKESADKIWQDVFELPANGPDGFSELTYSFDVKNTHFIVLSTNKPEEHLVNKTQRDWLEEDLKKNQKENIFVFFHEPAYPVSSKINESLDVNPTGRNALWTILKNYQVTAVFNGHEHIASRRQVDGIYQFVVGNTDSFDHDAPKPGIAEYSYKGHHYAIVSVNGKEITVNIYKVDGSLLNSFVIPK